MFIVKSDSADDLESITAHCTGGASGQGCNSALEDAATIAHLMHNFDIDTALDEFSKRRVEQGHALLDLAVTANQPKAPLLVEILKSQPSWKSSMTNRNHA